MAAPTLPFDDRKTADESFADFDEAFPQVYELFRRFALELWDAGMRKGGARLIGERIRWHVATGSRDEYGRKLNDHYWPRYARKLAAEDGRFKTFFEFRERRAK